MDVDVNVLIDHASEKIALLNLDAFDFRDQVFHYWDAVDLTCPNIRDFEGAVPAVRLWSDDLHSSISACPLTFSSVTDRTTLERPFVAMRYFWPSLRISFWLTTKSGASIRTTHDSPGTEMLTNLSPCGCENTVRAAIT